MILAFESDTQKQTVIDLMQLVRVSSWEWTWTATDQPTSMLRGSRTMVSRPAASIPNTLVRTIARGMQAQMAEFHAPAGRS